MTDLYVTIDSANITAALKRTTAVSGDLRSASNIQDQAMNEP